MQGEQPNSTSFKLANPVSRARRGGRWGVKSEGRSSVSPSSCLSAPSAADASQKSRPARRASSGLIIVVYRSLGEGIDLGAGGRRRASRERRRCDGG